MILAVSKFDRIGGWATVIAVVLALIGIAVGYVLYRRGKKSKTFDYTPVVMTSIVRKPVSNISDGLLLSWNGTPLQTPFSTIMRFSNTGNEAISKDDFRKPLVLDFGESTCYEATISRVSNDSLMAMRPIKIDSPASTVEVPVNDMNAGESFEVTCIVDGTMGYPQPSTYVFGATRSMASTLQVTKPLWVGLVGLALGIAIWALLFILAGINLHNHPNASPSGGRQVFNSILLFGGGVLLGVSTSYLMRRSARKVVAYRDNSIPLPTL